MHIATWIQRPRHGIGNAFMEAAVGNVAIDLDVRRIPFALDLDDCLNKDTLVC